jgi:uncharacterized protein (DUF1697 family)
MSARYVALLRGINVGTAKQMAMADLKAVLERLGYADVRTYLRSGQAVFTADGGASAKTPTKIATKLATDIDQAITADLGMDVRVVVRSRAELAGVLESNPFATQDRVAKDPAKLFCIFLSDRLTAADLKAVDPAAYAPEEFHLARGGREIFLWLPDGMGKSKLGTVKWPRVTGRKDLVGTARNWRTTLKLLELLDG